MSEYTYENVDILLERVKFIHHSVPHQWVGENVLISNPISDIFTPFGFKPRYSRDIDFGIVQWVILKGILGRDTG